MTRTRARRGGVRVATRLERHLGRALCLRPGQHADGVTGARPGLDASARGWQAGLSEARACDLVDGPQPCLFRTTAPSCDLRIRLICCGQLRDLDWNSRRSPPARAQHAAFAATRSTSTPGRGPAQPGPSHAAAARHASGSEARIDAADRATPAGHPGPAARSPLPPTPRPARRTGPPVKPGALPPAQPPGRPRST